MVVEQFGIGDRYSQDSAWSLTPHCAICGDRPDGKEKYLTYGDVYRNDSGMDKTLHLRCLGFPPAHW